MNTTITRPAQMVSGANRTPRTAEGSAGVKPATLPSAARAAKQNEEPMIVDTSDIPEVQRNNIASAVLDGVISFFEDAGNQARYEKWLAAREG